MAFDWITFLITLAIGIIGGLLSGAATTIAGRIALNRKINKELKRLQNFGQKTVFCVHCKREVPKEAAFCVLCGNVVSGEKMCSKCNISLPNKAKFCYCCQGTAEKKPKIDKKKKKADKGGN